MKHLQWLLALIVCVAPAVGAQDYNKNNKAKQNAAQIYQQPKEQAVNPAAAQAAQQVVQPQAPQQTVATPAAAVAISKSLDEGAILARRARVTDNAADKQQAIVQAEAVYARALEANPNEGKLLNNLAVLSVNKGDAGAARQYFERAIATNDTNKGYYALNYSKFLQTSDKPAAIKAARVAVEAAPDSAVANEHLGTLLWQTNPTEMLPFANSLVARGHTELATRFAVQCLTSQSRPPEERRAWLVLLASRLANEYALSAEVRDSMATMLAKFEGDPEIGAGSQQLRAVIGNPPSKVGDVEWWRNQSSRPPTQAVSGRAAMRNVLVAASEFNFSRDAARAERYLTTAIELGDRGPDPDAFLRLVELYATRSGKEGNADASKALAELMNRYQYALFTEKGDAYMRGDWPLIYRMHVALGMTYAYLGTWRSQVEYQNAVFQLSNAMRAAEQANKRPQQGAGSSRLALPPSGVQKLAQGYEEIGRKELSLKTRVEGASALYAAGNVQDSADVFRSITASDVQALDASSRGKYDSLRGALKL